MTALIFNDSAALTTGQKVALVMPFAAQLNSAALRLNVAPTGAAATFDIESDGISLLPSVLSVAISAFAPTTAHGFQKNGTITGAAVGTGANADKIVYTVGAGHLFKAGDVVTVASVTTSAGGATATPYNVTDKQVHSVTSTTVTLTTYSGTPGTYSSGGTMVSTTSPVVVPAGAVLSFDVDQIGSTVAGSGYTLVIDISEPADTSKAAGGLDSSRF